MSNVNWSVEDNSTLLQLIQQQVSYTDIATQMNRKTGDIKYHTGNLAVVEFNNGAKEEDVCNKYNLTSTQLHSAVGRVKRQEAKRLTRSQLTNNQSNNQSNNQPIKERRKVRLISPTTSEEVQTKYNKQDLILQYLKEIKELLIAKQ